MNMMGRKGVGIGIGRAKCEFVCGLVGSLFGERAAFYRIKLLFAVGIKYRKLCL